MVTVPAGPPAIVVGPRQSGVRRVQALQPRRVLLIYRGVPVLVADYLGFGYHRSVSLAAKLHSDGALGQRPLLAVATPPAQPKWRPASHAGLLGYYRHVLDGAIMCYLRAAVLRRLAKAYPGAVRLSARSRSFRLNVGGQARLCQAAQGLVVGALLRGGDGAWLAVAARRQLPRAPSGATAGLLAEMKFLRPYAACFILGRGVAPAESGGRPTAWFRDSCFADSLLHWVGGIVAAHPGRCAAWLNNDYGSLRFFVFRGVRPTDAEVAVRLASCLTLSRGRIDERGALAAATALRELCSPTQIGSGMECRFVIRRAYRVAGPLRAGTAIRLAPVGGWGRLLVLTQRRPMASTLPHTLAHGGFYFQVAASRILMPLIHKTLSTARPGPGLALPSAREIMKSFYTVWPFPRRLYGVRLAFVRK